jgi:transglutaminase-like putative cysteine protease
VDAFGNLSDHLTVEDPHDELRVVARSRITVWPAAPPPPPLWEQRWEDVAAATSVAREEHGLLARVCRLPSPFVQIDEPVREFAAASFLPGRAVGEALGALTERVFREFRFDPDVTVVSTPVAEVLEHRHGVCQDFAHLTIAALRSIGLGARYVSGYLETLPPPGQDKLLGADASHAWVGVYLPGGGWIDVDPTNGLVQPDRHLTVAWGRDYGDVTPLRGVVVGPAARQELTVSVDVARL